MLHLPRVELVVVVAAATAATTATAATAAVAGNNIYYLFRGCCATVDLVDASSMY